MADNDLAGIDQRANTERRKPGPKKTWVIASDSTKSCSRCHETKSYKEFTPQARGKFGVGATCRKCLSSLRKEKYKAERAIVLERAASYRAANPEKVRSAKLAAMEKKPEYYRAKSRRWKKNNAERVNSNERARRARRGDELKPLNRAKQKRFYTKKRGDPSYRLQRAFSSAVRQSLRLGKQGRSSLSLVPYSSADLRLHLERQFLPGMSWDNYGPVWHVDHIVPVKSFSFKTSDCADFVACWALTNLRPLWKHDNMVKQGRRLHLL